MLGDLCSHLLDEYSGDLQRLRDAADRDPAAERKMLKAFKGLGDVGVDIFLREAQAVWDELIPSSTVGRPRARTAWTCPRTPTGSRPSPATRPVPRACRPL